MKPPTLNDVAATAGVSLATASRTLNGDNQLVREDLRNRVLAAAEQLGYVPNAQAQALARATTATIGLIVHDISDPYFAAIAKGVAEVADERELFLMIASSSATHERELAYLSALAAQRVRAIILAGSGFESTELRRRTLSRLDAYIRMGGRVACINEHGMPIDTVDVDNRGGARRLTEMLIGLGHREFGVIAGPASLTAAAQRLRGIEDALAAHELELPAEHVVSGRFSRDGGFDAADELLDRAPGITAIVAVADIMAIGALAALRRRGLVVPDDVSLVGFDDIQAARDVEPALTTVRVGMEQLGARAVNLVLQDPDEEPRRVDADVEIVERASTAPPRPAKRRLPDRGRST